MVQVAGLLHTNPMVMEKWAEKLRPSFVEGRDKIIQKAAQVQIVSYLSTFDSRA
jgi:hypothetical protein